MTELAVKEQFVELRGSGLNFASIAEKLNISKTTLIQWSKIYQADICNLKQVHAEALRERFRLTSERHKYLHPNITKKPKTSYLNYRCTTPTCVRFNKSVRTKVILAAVYDFLNKHPFANKKAYDRYVPEMERIIKERNKETESLLRSLNVQLRNLAEHKKRDTGGGRYDAQKGV